MQLQPYHALVCYRMPGAAVPCSRHLASWELFAEVMLFAMRHVCSACILSCMYLVLYVSLSCQCTPVCASAVLSSQVYQNVHTCYEASAIMSCNCDSSGQGTSFALLFQINEASSPGSSMQCINVMHTRGVFRQPWHPPDLGTASQGHSYIRGVVQVWLVPNLGPGEMWGPCRSKVFSRGTPASLARGHPCIEKVSATLRMENECHSSAHAFPVAGNSPGESARSVCVHA